MTRYRGGLRGPSGPQHLRQSAGAGPALGPRWPVWLCNRERFPESAAQLQRYTGRGPGDQAQRGQLLHSSALLLSFHRQSFHEYAKESVLWCRWAGADHLQQRSKGSHHHTAVRALAFKWQRVIWRCWQDRKPYEETKYEAALRKAGSPLVALFDRVELGKSWKNPAKKN